MQDTDDVALWYALYRFVTNYWAEVDLNSGEAAHSFYLPDAVFEVGQNRFEGQEKIRAFYQHRRRRGISTTRHLISNLQVLPREDETVRLVGVLSLYRADGAPPFHGERAPMLIADLRAECVRDENGGWLYRAHVLQPLFVGSDIPYSISIDPDALRNVSAS